jgi:hypothetical protein
MKWAILALFVIGLIFVLWGIIGYRIDARNGQSADVVIGNGILILIGCVIWAIDVVVLVITAIVNYFLNNPIIG